MSFSDWLSIIHLQPVYKDRLWIRADREQAGAKAVEKIRNAFPHLSEESFHTFSEAQFEFYYPPIFQEEVKEVLAITDNQSKRKRKSALLQKVLDSTKANGDAAHAASEVNGGV